MINETFSIGVGDVRIFNLLNGIEIVGKIGHVTDEHIWLENALVMILREKVDENGHRLLDERGYPVMTGGMVPASGNFGDTRREGITIPLQRTAIVYSYELNDVASEAYLKQTSALDLSQLTPSGIIV